MAYQSKATYHQGKPVNNRKMLPALPTETLTGEIYFPFLEKMDQYGSFKVSIVPDKTSLAKAKKLKMWIMEPKEGSPFPSAYLTLKNKFDAPKVVWEDGVSLNPGEELGNGSLAEISFSIKEKGDKTFFSLKRVKIIEAKPYIRPSRDSDTEETSSEEEAPFEIDDETQE